MRVRSCSSSGSEPTRITTGLTQGQFSLEIKPTRNEADYEAALREIERLLGAKEGTPEWDRLDVLTTLVQGYEAKHFPTDAPDPIKAIKFRFDQQRLDHRALAGVIGGRSRAYEVMHRKRGLSLEMIRRLNDLFGIPAEVLIQRVRAARRRRPAYRRERLRKAKA